MFSLTKPANKHEQMLTCSSFLLFPANLFKYWTEAEPSSFPSQCLTHVHTESTQHPSSSKFPTPKEESGIV